mmetsp:Transcript_7818/g.18619  ORF Transcript_7818/g.18619 Transcript_7818/m.18619 type:complete len:213 (-) Transcript_7818:182-820(-)
MHFSCPKLAARSGMAEASCNNGSGSTPTPSEREDIRLLPDSSRPLAASSRRGRPRTLAARSTSKQRRASSTLDTSWGGEARAIGRGLCGLDVQSLGSSSFAPGPAEAKRSATNKASLQIFAELRSTLLKPGDCNSSCKRAESVGTQAAKWRPFSTRMVEEESRKSIWKFGFTCLGLSKAPHMEGSQGSPQTGTSVSQCFSRLRSASKDSQLA